MDASKARLVEEGFCTAKEAAAFLGVSRTRLYQLVKAGVLTCAFHGRHISVSRRALREYAAQCIVIGTIA